MAIICRAIRIIFMIPSIKTSISFRMRLNSCPKIIAIALGILAGTLSSCHKEPVLAPGTPEVCFDQQVLPAIQANCAMAGCHDGGEMNDLSTFEGIKSYVTDRDPVKSKLYKVITAKGLITTIMPPKPRPRLTVEQINLITIWILQGAAPTKCP